jgi:hypothetical protein
MKIAMSSGHGLHIRGARGNPVPPQLDEVDQARRVVDRVAQMLDGGGIACVTFHDNTSHDQSTNLKTITNWHNKQTRDYDVSVHFNAYDHSAHGVEVLYVSQQSLAARVSSAIAAAGPFTDRGAKKRTDLAFLNNTDKPAILLETCFCDNTSDSNKFTANFEMICKAIAESISGQKLTPDEPGDRPPEQPPERPPVVDRPPPIDEAIRPDLKKGDSGPYVVSVQETLGVLLPDGDFGSITDTWVRAFQAACGLGVDGYVGEKTWAELDDLDNRIEEGEPPLPKKLADQIYTMAQESEIADYSWPDRGIPPPGYIAGMALSFAYAVGLDDDATNVMRQAEGNPDKDALAWYAKEFANLGMSNKREGNDTLRHLFVMQIGLGPRESSGKYCEGRDLSASNVQSDTCEAGLFQTSWNIKAGSSAIAPLLDDFWRNPNGFLSVFKEGISPTANNLNSYGSGDGIRYQFLSRFCPLFHVMVTGVGMRTLRAHWGPIGRREVTLKKEADDLLKQVQELVESVA